RPRIAHDVVGDAADFDDLKPLLSEVAVPAYVHVREAEQVPELMREHVRSDLLGPDDDRAPQDVRRVRSGRERGAVRRKRRRMTRHVDLLPLRRGNAAGTPPFPALRALPIQLRW